MAGSRKFTRTPKTEDLVPKLREAGVGLHVLPTYLCVLDHADNKTGRCWMSLNRIAQILGLCRRTVERHMKALVEAGLVLRNHQQRGKRGRFSTRRYVVVAVLFFKRSTVRHQGRTSKRSLYKKKNYTSFEPEKYINELDKTAREEAIKRRTDGYEWLFG